jgi:lipoyl(octanoyl) transferase
MLIERLGRVDYMPTFEAMQAFTGTRGSHSADRLWLCEHPPVFTQGLAGQVVAYPLLDLRRAGYYVKEYVYRIEEAVIRTLSHLGVTGHRVAGSPGIYVRLDAPASHAALTGPRPADEPFRGLGKIAALGIKVSRHCTYHGLALNVAMDLQPYSRINPCGYAGLQSIDLSTIGVDITWDEAAHLLGNKLSASLAP